MNQAPAVKNIRSGIVPLPKVGEEIGFVTSSGTFWKGFLVNIEDGRYYLRNAEAFHSDGHHLYTAIGDELVHIEQENILKEIFFRSSSSAGPLFNEGGNSISKRDSYRMSNPNTNSNIYWNIKAPEFSVKKAREPKPVSLRVPDESLCSVVTHQRRRRSTASAGKMGPPGDSAAVSSDQYQLQASNRSVSVDPKSSNESLKQSSLTYSCSNNAIASTPRPVTKPAAATNHLECSNMKPVLAEQCSNMKPVPPEQSSNLKPVPPELLRVLFAFNLASAGDAPSTVAVASNQYHSSIAGSSSFSSRKVAAVPKKLPANESDLFFDAISSTIVDSYGKKPVTLWPNPMHQSANKDAFNSKALQTVTPSHSSHMKFNQASFATSEKETMQMRSIRKPLVRTGDPELDQKRSGGLLPTPRRQPATPYPLQIPAAARNKTSPVLAGPRAHHSAPAPFPPSNLPALPLPPPPPPTAARFPFVPWMPCPYPTYYPPQAPVIASGTRPEDMGYCWHWPYYPYPMPVPGLPASPHGVPTFATYAPGGNPMPHLPHVAPRHQKLAGATSQQMGAHSSNMSKASDRQKQAIASNEPLALKSEPDGCCWLYSAGNSSTSQPTRSRRSNAREAEAANASASDPLTCDVLQTRDEVVEEFSRKIKEVAHPKNDEPSIDPSTSAIQTADSTEDCAAKQLDTSHTTEDTFEAVPSSSDTTANI